MRAFDSAAAGPSPIDRPAEPATTGGPERLSARRRWFVVVILLVFYVVSIADRQILTMLATAIQKDFGLTDVQLGLLQGFAFSIIYGSAGLAMAWVADRFSTRLVIFFGVIVWSISCSLGGTVSSFLGLFLTRLGVGFGEAGLTPSSHSVIRSMFGRDRLALPIAVYSMGGTLGAGLSFVIGSALLRYFEQDGNLFAGLLVDHAPWQVALIAIGLPGLLVAGFSFFIPREGRPSGAGRIQAAAGERTFGRFLLGRKLVLFCHMAGFALMIMNTYALLAWLPAYLERVHALPPSALGSYLFIIFGVAPAIGGFVVGLFADRLFQRGYRAVHFQTMAIVGCLEAVAVGAAFLMQGFWPLMAFLAVRGLVSGATLVCGGAALQALSPPEYGARLSALYLFAIGGIGGGLGPILVGLVTETIFHDRAAVGASLSIVCAAASLIATMLFLIGTGPLRRALAARL